MFNPNDLELTRHLIAAKSFMRDVDKLVRDKKEKDLFLNCLLAWRALDDAMHCLNRMKK